MNHFKYLILCEHITKFKCQPFHRCNKELVKDLKMHLKFKINFQMQLKVSQIDLVDQSK